MLFKIKNHRRPSTTVFRYSSKIHTFWAYFEEKQPRNACDMAKMICYSKIQLCVMSCSCIFWHVENFYHHKNYMVNYWKSGIGPEQVAGSRECSWIDLLNVYKPMESVYRIMWPRGHTPLFHYCTLCSILYNWFYIKKCQFLLVMTEMLKNQLQQIWTSFLVVFFGSVQFVGVLGQLATATSCWSIQIGPKNQTGPDLWTLVLNFYNFFLKPFHTSPASICLKLPQVEATWGKAWIYI